MHSDNAIPTSTTPRVATPGKYPRQVIFMASAETAERIAREAQTHQLSKSEVARLYIEAGMEAADAAAGA